MRIKRVSRKESKIARMEFYKIIKILRPELKGLYKFDIRLNGSAKFNCIVKDTNGQYDIDYRMILTKNSKSDNFTKNLPTNIRNEIFNYFKKCLKDFGSYISEQSNSVITLIKKDATEKRIWSYDICIMKYAELNMDNDFEYLARNSQNNSIDGGNSYTWCLLKDSHIAYDKFKNLSYDNKINIIEEFVIPSKIEMKKISTNDKRWKSSEQIFIEKINQYIVQ